MHIQQSKIWTGQNTTRWKQRGVVLPLFVIGMLAILAMAGLAIDMSHAMLNKSRLQSTVDAAALTGAKVLHETGQMTLARAAALELFTDNSTTDGNGEMAAAVDVGAVTVEFASQLTPFSADGSPPFIRVTIEDFTMDAFLIQVLGFGDKRVSASAVSGPSPIMDDTVCDLAPFIVCEYPSAAETDPFYGYSEFDVNVLKGSSKTDTNTIGGGNFFLAALDDVTGGSTLAENAAGGYEGCATVGNNILTEPGNKRGPTAATNQRIGCTSGGNCGPGPKEDMLVPDLITQQPNPPLESLEGTLKVYSGPPVLDAAGQPDESNLIGDGAWGAPDPGLGATALDFSYATYVTLTGAATPTADAAPSRRNLTVVVADCSEKNEGRHELPIVGFACYFMLQEISKGGDEDELFGQFTGNCEGSGVISPIPGDGPGPTKIILYKDTDSIDS
jgi:hypothetical protein